MEKKTFEQVRLQFGVYKNSLCKAESGFAAEAWQEGDAEFNDVAAQSFIAITADDCKRWNIGRHNIRRLESQEEFDKLLEQAHPAFKRLVELWHMDEHVKSRMDVEYYRKVREMFGGSTKYSDIYGVHLFKNDDSLWTHEFAIFNNNESGLDSKVFEEFRDSLPTWDAVVELAEKITGWMNRNECDKQLNKHGEGLYIFEFYCSL